MASCDKAQDLFNNNSAKNVFRSVSVPQKQYPALVGFRELQGISHLKGTENKAARVAQENALKRRLVEQNPGLRGHLESVRVLHQRPNSNSFLFRIAFTSKPFCEHLIKNDSSIPRLHFHRVNMPVAHHNISKASAPLKCFQINLRHSRCAALNLSQLILDLDIDVILIQ